MNKELKTEFLNQYGAGRVIPSSLSAYVEWLESSLLKARAPIVQQTQAGADAPKPCAKCIYNELGGPHPIDCRNCIHGPAQIDKFNPMRTASAC